MVKMAFYSPQYQQKATSISSSTGKETSGLFSDWARVGSRKATTFWLSRGCSADHKLTNTAFHLLQVSQGPVASSPETGLGCLRVGREVEAGVLPKKPAAIN